MTDLQALIAGFIAGALAHAQGKPLLIDVAVSQDGEGNYLPEIEVRGQESGERLLVRIEAQP
jgi:hypothetical protein